MLKRFTPILALVGLCWLVLLVNNVLLSGHLNQYGIVPRHLGGLPGIVWAPFLHRSFQHLAANTVPLLVLGSILCARNRSEFLVVVVAGTALTGGLTWIFARDASHIGASGLIFCCFGYLTSMACFRRTFGALLLSVICILAYGGMLKGVLPTSLPISWEEHIAGLVSGVFLAWVGAKTKPAQPEVAIRPVGITDTLKK